MASDYIRAATPEDKPEIFRMGEHFFNASGYAEIGDYDTETLGKTLDLLIGNDSLLIADGGMIGWLVFPVFMTGTPIAQELFWWVDEDKRKSGLGARLLKAAEQKAKEQGAEQMMMLCLDNLEPEKAESVYGKLGYKPRERTYMRAL